jgi:hypothetical protein
MERSTTEHSFSSTLPIQIFIRPAGDPPVDWQEFDRGPGFFHIPSGPSGVEVMVRARNIDDIQLRSLVKELAGCPAITFLNLSENRKITELGLDYLRPLVTITGLNLSSCSLNDQGLVHLSALTQLAHLDLSYCNRLTDVCVKHIRALNRLRFLDLQGCVKISNGGISRIARRGLTIHR